jgi:hypothetical protein
MARSTKAQDRRAAKDRVLQAARALVREGVISSRASGPAAPVFDEHDAAVERNRGKSYSVDGEKLDGLKDALAGLDR